TTKSAYSHRVIGGSPTGAPFEIGAPNLDSTRAIVIPRAGRAEAVRAAASTPSISSTSPMADGAAAASSIASDLVSHIASDLSWTGETITPRFRPPTGAPFVFEA